MSPCSDPARIQPRANLLGPSRPPAELPEAVDWAALLKWPRSDEGRTAWFEPEHEGMHLDDADRE